MRLAFDQVKATQAAAAFLRQRGGTIQYLALIKLLYKLDREALRRWGMSVTTDKHSSLKLGPIVSKTYDLIKAGGNPSAAPTFWSSHIRTEGYNVALSLDPGTSELSPAEEALILEIYKSDGTKDGFVLSDEFHKSFSEWKDPGDSSRPIEIEEILTALGVSEEQAGHTELAISAQRAASRLSI